MLKSKFELKKEKVAITFLGQGIRILTENAKHTQDKDFERMAGYSAVGVACIAQGFELFLKSALAKLDISHPNSTGHEIRPLFIKIEDSTEIQSMLKECEVHFGIEPDWVDKTISVVEKNFMPARYFGFPSRKHLEVPSTFQVALIALCLIRTIFPNSLQFAFEEFGSDNEACLFISQSEN